MLPKHEELSSPVLGVKQVMRKESVYFVQTPLKYIVYFSSPFENES